jgi:hypothetical protein
MSQHDDGVRLSHMLEAANDVLWQIVVVDLPALVSALETVMVP